MDGSSSVSSKASTISSKRLRMVLEMVKCNQNRKLTMDNYLSIWRHFNKFLLNLDGIKPDTWEERVTLFGAYLVDEGIKSTTLKSYFSAIKSILATDGYVWNDNRTMLSSLVKGCRIINDKLNVCLSITKGLLELLLFEVQRTFRSNNQPYLEILYKTAFSLAYYGMLHVGELTQGTHVIKARNIHVAHNKNKIMMVLYSSKTHSQDMYPQKIKISAADNYTNCERKITKQHFCPFKLIRQFLTARGNFVSESENFFIFTDRSPVKPLHVRKLLRQLLADMDLDPLMYNMHSLRAGCAVDMLHYRYTISQIKSAGHWQSNVIYKYLKN